MLHACCIRHNRGLRLLKLEVRNYEDPGTEDEGNRVRQLRRRLGMRMQYVRTKIKFVVSAERSGTRTGVRTALSVQLGTAATDFMPFPVDEGKEFMRRDPITFESWLGSLDIEEVWDAKKGKIRKLELPALPEPEPQDWYLRD